MIELIKSRQDLCTGCNRCVRECPMETANITYLDENGNIKVRIDHSKCINCGRCITMCKHEARYYEDDTARFFDDLAAGVPISLIAAPSIRTNIPEYKRLFTYLKSLGIDKIYDVSLGADICIWAHVRYLEECGQVPMISQPCPVIVSYCEIYRHELIEKLSPLHSPMACAAIYMKEYEGITGNIAALSPCIAKSIEFEATGIAQYNVTFAMLQQYLKDNDVELPEEETEFDHNESGLGSIFPMPGGLKENIDFYFEKKIHVAKAEGFGVFRKLDTYSKTLSDLLPVIFDVLNCAEGCNAGPAVECERNVFEIESIMNKSRNAQADAQRREWLNDLYRSFDEKLDLYNFIREYQKIDFPYREITQEDIDKAYVLLGKTDYEKQHVDCSACGSETCYDMARKIALGVNIATNCIVFVMESAKEEHEQNLEAHEQLVKMEKLREADERIRILVDSNPHINVLFNDKFDVLDCNPAAVEFLGFKTKQELIDGFLERTVKSIPPYQSSGKPSVPLIERFLTVVNEGSASFETDLVIDGIVRTLDVNFKKIPYADSFAIVGYFYDMTNMHEREMELKRAHELNQLQLTKLKIAVQATKIGLWDTEVNLDDPVNPENTFHWSDEFRNMLGYEDENDFPNVLKSLDDIMHPEDRVKTLEAFANHMLDRTGNTPYDVEYRVMKKNGQYGYYRASAETTRDSFGNPMRVIGSLMDITETKNILFESEQQRIEAQAASKAKSAFLSTMSHEIRTPMNAIIGITEVMLQNDSLDDDTKEALGKIYISGDMLLGIINDMLDLSKIESGNMELLIYKYEIASLVSDTIQLNMLRIGSKQIEFELNIDKNVPSSLYGDELRVKQILNNILSNAFKYTQEGSVELSISSEPDDSGADDTVIVVFEISDTGQGMTKEQVDKIFDEYSRFNMMANRTTEGTGLGMSITQNLISMMNGSITVESEPGKGSIFTVRLPQGSAGADFLSQEMIDNLRQFRSSKSQLRRSQLMREPMPYGSVLIVDDVDTNIYVAIGLLSPYKLKIDKADSGFTAIEKIKDGNTYDIIFMDHMMPQMDGIEATRIIRDLGYEKPIVALTANAVAGQADVFLNSGFDDFVAKPVDVRQLNSVLNRLIRDKQPPEVIEEARQEAISKQEQLMETEQISETEQTAEAGKQVSAGSKFAEVFVRDAARTLAALDTVMSKNGDFDEDDIRSYTIHVHGIKSALASIGKTELSAYALLLETAARNGDMELVMLETRGFVAGLSSLVDELTPASSAVGSDNDAGEEDSLLLKEGLLAIKSATDDFDEKTIEDTLAALQEKAWPQAVKELLSAIGANLLHSDFDDIVEDIDAYLGMQ